MTTIQEIRDALKELDEAETELIKNKGEDIKVRLDRMYRVQVAEIAIHRGSIDYIRTLLAALDTKTPEISSELVARATKAEQERDALRAEVERLKDHLLECAQAMRDAAVTCREMECFSQDMYDSLPGRHDILRKLADEARLLALLKGGGD